MSNKYAVSLNSNNPDEQRWEQWIAQFDSPSSAIKYALMVACDGPQYEEQAIQADNSEVLAAIDELKNEVKALTRRGISPEQEAEVMPGGIEAKLEEIDPNADTPFLVGLRNNTFKPGMRLD